MYNINPSSTCTVQPDSRKKVISVDFFKLRIKGLSHYMCIYIPISIYLLHWVLAALLKEHQGREGSDLPF